MMRTSIVMALTAVVLAGAAGARASTPTTVIPYQDTHYRYSVVAAGAGAGFEQPGFDDTGFSVGDAAFGAVTGGCPLDATVRTAWPSSTDILVRKPFNLQAGSTGLQVHIGIDNDVQVFLNGIDISGGLNVHDGCATLDSFVFSAPDSVLFVGQNLLAVRGHDRGGDTFLDVEVTADIPASAAPALSPVALGMLGLVMLVAGMYAVEARQRVR